MYLVFLRYYKFKLGTNVIKNIGKKMFESWPRNDKMFIKFV